MHETTVATVPAFGGPEVLQRQRRPLGRRRRGQVRVAVSHASLGSTDALARSGGYLLQPRPGFTPGYDFVGTVLEGPDDGPEPGTRVAGCLARMGGHATVIDTAPGRLVPVPASLSSEVAAALPLDLVTAALATTLADVPDGGSLLVQGVSGPVGNLVAQLGSAAGRRVYGTASERTRPGVAAGVTVLDYRDQDWPRQLLAAEPGGVDAVIDHTGAAWLRDLAGAGGTVVRTAFAGRPGRERADTARGFVAALARSAGRPRERVCSVPILVTARPRTYRRLLAEQLELVAAGRLTPRPVRVVPLSEVVTAHRELADGSGHKVVLDLT